ncbi:glycosyltransferase family 2 protein [Microbulbifer hainanensis]|uniref:glycosyltransferase family 2 protein n=1 Tax=Microbulbifer hainanensis TaxID=2735675 RepID=UPI001866857B|nr:glycosyltransferase family 2 protein [Microbulbifer hainanensis]
MFDLFSKSRFLLTVFIFKIARKFPLGFISSIKKFRVVEILFNLVKDEKHRERFSYDRLQEVQNLKLRSMKLEGSPIARFIVGIKVERKNLNVLDRTLRSLEAQNYNEINIYIQADEELRSSVLSRVKVGSLSFCWIDDWSQLKPEKVGAESYLIFMDAGDLLHENALYFISNMSAELDLPEVLYMDSDSYDEAGRRFNPQCKPSWSPDYFLEYPYIGKGVWFRFDSIVYCLETHKECSVNEINYCGILDLYFLKESNVDIQAVAYILYHENLQNININLSTHVKNYLDIVGKTAGFHVNYVDDFSCRRISWGSRSRSALVSIIIPTKDRVDLLSQCVDSICNKTTYKNYEIIVVDNNSENPESFTYFNYLKQKPNISVISCPGEFNFSAINNRAVEISKGELIAFVNNDIEVISGQWLEIMISHALRPEIGCVGAKLYYPDDTVQHGGVLIGIGGVAGHAHKNFGRRETGYMNRLTTTQNYSAVTGACLVVRKDIFESVGGFDETNLKVAFNDVDLCLKVQKLGFRNLWTPYAELYHHESVSRGDDRKGAAKKRYMREIEYMKKVWKTDTTCDLAYNPNLAVYREDFGLITLD